MIKAEADMDSQFFSADVVIRSGVDKRHAGLSFRAGGGAPCPTTQTPSGRRRRRRRRTRSWTAMSRSTSRSSAGESRGSRPRCLLQRAGRRCAVIEARRIGKGETGKSTAHLTTALDVPYHTLISRFGLDGARLAAAAQRAAIERICTLGDELKIACDFHRVPGFLYAERPRDVSELEREAEAVGQAGHAGGAGRARAAAVPGRARAALRQSGRHASAHLPAGAGRGVHRRRRRAVRRDAGRRHRRGRPVSRDQRPRRRHRAVGHRRRARADREPRAAAREAGGLPFVRRVGGVGRQRAGRDLLGHGGAVPLHPQAARRRAPVADRRRRGPQGRRSRRHDAAVRAAGELRARALRARVPSRPTIAGPGRS